MEGNWFVADLVDGRRVRGRLHLDVHAKSGAYPYKVDIHWKRGEAEFDQDMTAKLEEQSVFFLEKDKDGFLALVSEDDKEFIFSWYVRNIQGFGNLLNRMLMLFPPLPISIFSMDDPEWTAYYSILKVVDNYC